MFERMSKRERERCNTSNKGRVWEREGERASDRGSEGEGREGERRRASEWMSEKERESV